jgi:hypothetical protein
VLVAAAVGSGVTVAGAAFPPQPASSTIIAMQAAKHTMRELDRLTMKTSVRTVRHPDYSQNRATLFAFQH